MIEFRDSNGRVYHKNDERLIKALDSVADDWLLLGLQIRLEDAYADHVSEKFKDDEFHKRIIQSRKIRKGLEKSFTIFQMVNEKLTGESVALF